MLIQTVRHLKGINTPISLSSDLKLATMGSDRILDIVNHFKCKDYLTGKGGLNYIDRNAFHEHGIEMNFVNYCGKYEDITILKYINDEHIEG
jgi:hypothetical protein